MQEIPSTILTRLRQGIVIPAHPLALDADRRFDERHQRALTRYYIDAGAGGIAIGVHTTQFEIRAPDIGLFEAVLTLASETIDDWCTKSGREIIKIAGICGRTEQAVGEASFAAESGFHAGLLSLAAMAAADIPELVQHCRKVADIIPMVGFYLQPAVGGRLLSYEFWREFAEIENVIAIKIAPFNRYQTFDVIRGVCEAGRQSEIALYTGNDDNIILDLLTEYRIATDGGERRARIVGGLLGHWAVWTQAAVRQLADAQRIVNRGTDVPSQMLSLAIQVTDANAAFFDVANGYSGCIPGIHEILRRQGLLPTTCCLDPDEVLSPGQVDEIDRVYAAYPHLNDDAFVRENLDRWLAA